MKKTLILLFFVFSVITCGFGIADNEAFLPTTVTIQEDIKVPLVLNGKTIGEMKIQKGKEAKVLSSDTDNIEILIGTQRTSIKKALTDFDARKQIILDNEKKLSEQKQEEEKLKRESIELKRLEELKIVSFKGLKLRLPLSELKDLLYNTPWGIDKLKQSSYHDKYDFSDPNLEIELNKQANLGSNDWKSCYDKPKLFFTENEMEDFGLIGVKGTGQYNFVYEWDKCMARFHEGRLAEIRVKGHFRDATFLGEYITWLQLAKVGLKKKYGEPSDIYIPLEKFNILDTKSGYFVYLEEWRVHNQTIRIGISESDFKFAPIIVFSDDELMEKIESAGKAESKL